MDLSAATDLALLGPWRKRPGVIGVLFVDAAGNQAADLGAAAQPRAAAVPRCLW
jgi:hypothetical protein